MRPSEEYLLSGRERRTGCISRAHTIPRRTRIHHDVLLYLFCICWVIWALCSWKRSLTRCWVAIHLRTQRLMQPFSREERALEVKSSTQLVKQCSTRPPNACANRQPRPGSSNHSLRMRYAIRRCLKEVSRTPINSLTWRFCMRCSSMRCSAVVNLGGLAGDCAGAEGGAVGEGVHIHGGRERG